MFTYRLPQIVVLSLLTAVCATSSAEFIVGCNAASQTNVDCATIFGGSYTDEGINFFTQTDYHVGYRRGLSASPDFLDTSTSVTHLDQFVTSLNQIPVSDGSLNDNVAGNTMVIEFDADTALSGLVLSGLSSFVPRGLDGSEGDIEFETAQVLAFNANGEIVFDKVFEGAQSYVYVDFGNVVPLINTLLVSSGGGLHGLTSTNTNVAYLITPLPEPASALLVLTGLALFAGRRRA